MRYDYTYEVHKTFEAQRLRHGERDRGHLRALRSDGRPQSVVSRIVGGLERLRSVGESRRGYINYETQVLTDKVCRLADGSLGRVAIREADGKMVEFCVPA